MASNQLFASNCVLLQFAPALVWFQIYAMARKVWEIPSVMMTFRMGGARFWARTRAWAWSWIRTWAWAWAWAARLRIRLLPHAPVLLDQAPGVVPWNQDSYMALTWSKEVAVNLEPVGEVERVDGGRSLSGIAADEQKLVIWHLEQHVVVHRTRKTETRIDHLNGSLDLLSSIGVMGMAQWKLLSWVLIWINSLIKFIYCYLGVLKHVPMGCVSMKFLNKELYI